MLQNRQVIYTHQWWELVTGGEVKKGMMVYNNDTDTEIVEHAHIQYVRSML